MKYWQAYNFGQGFITHEDRMRFNIEGKAGDIYVTDDAGAALEWGARVSAKQITSAEADAIWAALPPSTLPDLK